MTKPFADHFSTVARAYATSRPHYPEDLFAYLATVPARRDLVWDCGAGSGQATLALAGHFHRVIATDASSAQVAAAPRHHRINYSAALAEASGLAAGVVDLVTVAQALHWFDLPAFYVEVRRVLAPGGALAVWTYGNSEFDHEPLDAIVRTFYHDVVGPYWPPERRHVEHAYRDLPFPFAELAAPVFAMEARWTLPELLGYVGTWSAVTRFRSARGEDPLLPLERALQEHWGSAAVRRIRWPLHLRIGCELPPRSGLKSPGAPAQV